MTTWLRIENGVVANVEVWAEEPPAVAGVTWRQDASAGVGWAFNGSAFTPPAPTAAPSQTPASVHRYQARGALYAAQPGGALLAAADALVAQQGGITAIWWNAAPEFYRADPRFNTLGALLTPPLAPADIDALFVAASKL